MKRFKKETIREIGDYCFSLGTGLASTMLVSVLLSGIVNRSEFGNEAIKTIFKVGAAAIGTVTGLKVMKEVDEQINNCHELEDSLIELIREKREIKKQKKLSKEKEA